MRRPDLSLLAIFIEYALDTPRFEFYAIDIGVALEAPRFECSRFSSEMRLRRSILSFLAIDIGVALVMQRFEFASDLRRPDLSLPGIQEPPKI